MSHEWVEIRGLKNAEDFAKCERCWRYYRECAYDRSKARKSLLCNRCSDVVKTAYPEIWAQCREFDKEFFALVAGTQASQSSK